MKINQERKMKFRIRMRVGSHLWLAKYGGYTIRLSDAECWKTKKGAEKALNDLRDCNPNAIIAAVIEKWAS